jgi:hypothetical protein
MSSTRSTDRQEIKPMGSTDRIDDLARATAVRSRSDASCATTIVLVALACLAFLVLAPPPSHAEDLSLLSIGVRTRVGGERVLGDVQPEAFHEYDAVAAFKLRWEEYPQSGWGVGTRLMAAAGALHGAQKTALVVSAIPVIAFGGRDGRFTVDLGAGAALLSAHRFGKQDYGGPLQFALTFGVAVPLYGRLGVGYRFLHYSDAGFYGQHTIGADFHMIEVSYRL